MQARTEHYETLATSLNRILAANGRHRPYEELVAVLGLGAAVVAAPREPLKYWPTFFRDARLVEATGFYGLRPRPLHPPATAEGLSRSAEFARHFNDSYAPLIRTALTHGQPVLAWRGWPAPASRCWGVITDERAGRFYGLVSATDDEPTPLIDPAHQVYIVEGRGASDETLSDADALFRYVARRQREMWRGEWEGGAGAVTGPRAYELWADCLHKLDERCSPLHEQHSRAVCVFIAAREQLAKFLAGVRGEHRESAVRWKQACERVAEIMRPFSSAGEVRSCLDRPGGIDSLTRPLYEACDLDVEVAELLAPVAP